MLFLSCSIDILMPTSSGWSITFSKLSYENWWAKLKNTFYYGVSLKTSAVSVDSGKVFTKFSEISSTEGNFTVMPPFW